MLTSPVEEIELDRSTVARYESLIRIAASIRAQKEPQDLFGILVQELGQVVQFDAIAQYDEESNKVALAYVLRLPQAGSHALRDRQRGDLGRLGVPDIRKRWFSAPGPGNSLSGFDRPHASGGLQSVCAFP